MGTSRNHILTICNQNNFVGINCDRCPITNHISKLRIQNGQLEFQMFKILCKIHFYSKLNCFTVVILITFSEYYEIRINFYDSTTWDPLDLNQQTFKFIVYLHALKITGWSRICSLPTTSLPKIEKKIAVQKRKKGTKNEINVRKMRKSQLYFWLVK